MGRRKKLTLKESVIQQALADVADRAETYGDAKVNHARVARLWTAWLNCKSEPNTVTPVDSTVFQILTNLARIAESPTHKGAWENIAGYAGVGYEVSS